MRDFKDQIIEAIERGWATEASAYDFVRDRMFDAADLERIRRKHEDGGEGYVDPLNELARKQGEE